MIKHTFYNHPNSVTIEAKLVILDCHYLVCYSNIYNQFCHGVKRHNVTTNHVLRPVKMHIETFIFCLNLSMHNSKLIPLLTKHSFKTLHQN